MFLRYLSDFYHFSPLIGHYHPPTRYRGKKCWSHMKVPWYVHVLAKRKRGARGVLGGALDVFLSIYTHFFPYLHSYVPQYERFRKKMSLQIKSDLRVSQIVYPVISGRGVLGGVFEVFE